MTSLYFLRRVLFCTSLCLFLFILIHIAQAETSDLSNQKYEVYIEKMPKEYEAGIRKYVYEDGTVRMEEIPATGHVWSEWIIDIEPTYTKKGHMYRVCKKIPNHPHYEERTIPVLKREEEDTSINNVATTHLDVVSTVKQTVDNAKQEKVEPIQRDAPKAITKEVQKNANRTEQNKQAQNGSESKVHPAICENNGFNVVDAIFIAGIVSASCFAYFVVMPLILVLVWAKKKRKEILGE